MSTGRQRDEVGTELIRATREQCGDAARHEDSFMCRVVGWALARFYARGWVFFQQITIEPAYESEQPRHPITPDADSDKPVTMPMREIMRTWRMWGRFGNLPKGKRHLHSRRTGRETLPAPLDIVDFDVEIHAYFHSYLLGWEPSIILVTLFEGNQPEPITAIVECRNATCTRKGKQAYQPTMTVLR